MVPMCMTSVDTMTGRDVRRGDALREAGDDFESFARDAGPRLLRFGHALAGNRTEAEDLVQETLVHVGLAWTRLRRDSDPTPYARRVLVNLFLNERRRRRRERLVPLVGEREYAGSGDASETSIALAEAKSLLDHLSPRQRAAVAMRYVLDLDDAVIASELDCTESTVRSQIARALETLRGIELSERGTRDDPS